MKRREFILLLVGVASAGCNTVDATVRNVLRDLPIASQIAQAILKIIATAPPAQVEARIERLVADIVAALVLLESMLREYRENIAHAPGGVLEMVDTAIATIAQNLVDILEAVRVYDPKIQAGVGVAITSLQMVLLGIVALIPRDRANQFPRTEQVMLSEHRELGAIRAEIPTPRHLAGIYNKGIGHDYPQAKVRSGFLP